MATAWQQHGNSMATTRQQHGNSRVLTAAGRNRRSAAGCHQHHGELLRKRRCDPNCPSLQLPEAMQLGCWSGFDSRGMLCQSK